MYLAKTDKPDDLSGLVRDVEQAIDALLTIEGKPPIYEGCELTECDPEPPFCSFCGKGKKQVKRMLQGKNAYICNQCVMLCHEIVSTGDEGVTKIGD
jgi:hypothetical protein